MISLTDAALDVLNTADAEEKAHKSREFAEQWRIGTIKTIGSPHCIDRPARPQKPDLLPPNKMPKRKAGGGTTHAIALFHALAHIELNAIDLAWDMIARFGHYEDQEMPQDFFNDWIKVGDEESSHFLMLSDRLKRDGSFYGALPAHDGLWESARDTQNHFAARLAVVPMVLEARGLDVTPIMIKKFKRQGDDDGSAILQTIHDEEIGHVAIGKRWFDWVAEKESKNPRDYWQELVETYFKGILKKPFNVLSRDKASFPQDWYEPLAAL